MIFMMIIIMLLLMDFNRDDISEYIYEDWLINAHINHDNYDIYDDNTYAFTDAF